MPFQLVRADITTMSCGAIVNAANAGLQAGGGVCGAIFRAAGHAKLQAACDAIGGCEVGQSVITPGFELRAKYVIHTVGPQWHGGGQGEEDLLRSCYRSALRLAVKHELDSIAFPLISAGIYGYPRQQAISVAAEEISAFLTDERTPDMDVTLVLYDTCSYREGRGLFGDIATYLDTHSPAYLRYQEERLARPMEESAWQHNGWPGTGREKRFGYPMKSPRNAAEDEHAFPAPTAAPSSAADTPAAPSGSRLREWIAARVQREETFSECLLRLIDASGEKDATIYKRANVDRRLFSKIRSNTHYQPGKSTVLAFCLALRLSVEDAEMLLGKAGYTLTHTSRFDLAVEYCMKHHIYDVHQVNIALFELDLPLLGA